MLAQVQAYLEEHEDRFVSELIDFLRIPSVSADSRHAPDTQRAAEFVRDQMLAAGLQAEVIATDGHPIVYGSWYEAEDAPTVLVYGHYDVQPPDPLDQWITPPFEPDIRDGYVYARGATDDKGQMLTHIKSAEAWLQTHGRLPVNLKFVIEGEEEVGSQNLDRFLEQRREELRSDIAVISDTSQFSVDIPAITYGLRGIMAAEIRLRGPRQDLHSGVFGGAVANPANVLTAMIGSLHDEQERVCIPGFYDDVRDLDDEERSQLAALPADEASFFRDAGISAGHGERGFSTTERRWARPTCDVNGIVSGYTGEGPKTIIPAAATAKISCRLVPDQDPVALARSLENFLREQCPPGITMEFIEYHGCAALVFDTSSPYMTAAQEAIAASFGREPVMIREGGSIPVVATFREILGIDTLLLGWGQNTDNLHSPNERFRLKDFHRGTHASALLWQSLADCPIE